MIDEFVIVKYGSSFFPLIIISLNEDWLLQRKVATNYTK